MHMRANDEEAVRHYVPLICNLDCLGRATKIHGDIFVSNAHKKSFICIGGIFATTSGFRRAFSSAFKKFFVFPG